jgi:hypothetical protein
MARINRVLGSILASTGGLLLLMTFLFGMISSPLSTFADLGLGALGLVGGILLAVDSKVGGILAIIAGAVALTFAVLTIATPVEWIVFWDESYWGFYMFEPILLLVGGIVGTPSGSS